MNYQLQEEFDAWVSRNDRFDGFDRGDFYEPVYVPPKRWDGVIDDGSNDIEF